MKKDQSNKQFDTTFYKVKSQGNGSASLYTQFHEGDTHLRLFTAKDDKTQGHLLFGEDSKPVRQREEFTAKQDPQKKAKEFKAFVAYNYDLGLLQVCEIAKVTILRALESLANNPRWGDPGNYDIIVNRSGQDKQTRYVVSPLPPSAVPKEALESYKATPIHLPALFAGKSPFELPENF